MRPYIVVVLTLVCSYIFVFADTKQELPTSYFGQYQGKITITQKGSKNSNSKDDVIVLGSKKQVKWQMSDLSSGKFVTFTGTYSILTENSQSYNLLCTVSSKQGNTTISGKFYLGIPKSGEEITFTDITKMRTVTLKKK